MAITLNGTNGVDTPGLVVDTNTLYVDKENNNVGIGTSSPGNFPGYGNLAINGSTGGNIQLMTNNVEVAYLGNSSTAVGLFGVTNVPLVFGTNDTERMRITADGKVGIGTSSPADTILEVRGQRTYTDNYGSFYDQDITLIGPANEYPFMIVEAFGGAASGGTATPDTWGGFNALRTRGTPESRLSTVSGDMLGEYGFQAYNSSLGGWSGASIRAIQSGAATSSGTPIDIFVQTNDGSSQFGAERMRITADGKVGVGTSNPGSKFEVKDGQIRINTSTGTFARIEHANNGTLMWTVGTRDNADDYYIYRESGSGNVLIPQASLLVTGPGGLGYGTGSGGSVTQETSRTTGVTLNKTNGSITLVSAAGSTTAASFTVTNSTVAATDTVIVNQRTGANLYDIMVTAVSAGSFRITLRTTGGTTTEAPVFNFAVIKAVTS